MLPNILQVFDTLSKRVFVPLFSLLPFLWTHYQTFPTFAIFSLVRLVFIFCQHLRWRRNGVWKKLNRIYYGLDYESSAQLLNVHLACIATTIDKTRTWNFIASHQEFVHPRFVLADDCMLAELTAEYALFVQLNKPLTEYSARTVTFLWAIVSNETKRIIIMPITSMRRLALEMGKPRDNGADVTFLWSSGRCGSTLITKIIDNADPDTLALSEPAVIMDMYMYKRVMPARDFDRFFEACLRLLVKPVTGKKRIFIKPIFFVLNVAEDVNKALPNARMLFVYRRPLRTVWAHERAFARTPYYRAMQIFLIANEWEWGERILGFHRNPPVDEVSRRTIGKSSFDLCCIIWADIYLNYQAQAKKFNFPALMYDRLFDNPHQFCADILSFYGLDSSRMAKALEALNGDSQAGSYFSQSALRGLKVTPFTAELKSRTDQFCDALNLPRLENENAGKQNQFSALAADSSMTKTEIEEGQANEYCNSFITGPDQLKFEIAHAGNGSGPSVSRPQLVQQAGTQPHKRPQLKPYYKPLPLQLIFSQD